MRRGRTPMSALHGNPFLGLYRRCRRRRRGVRFVRRSGSRPKDRGVGPRRGRSHGPRERGPQPRARRPLARPARLPAREERVLRRPLLREWATLFERGAAPPEASGPLRPRAVAAPRVARARRLCLLPLAQDGSWAPFTASSFADFVYTCMYVPLASPTRRTAPSRATWARQARRTPAARAARGTHKGAPTAAVRAACVTRYSLPCVLQAESVAS